MPDCVSPVGRPVFRPRRSHHPVAEVTCRLPAQLERRATVGREPSHVLHRPQHSSPARSTNSAEACRACSNIRVNIWPGSRPASVLRIDYLKAVAAALQGHGPAIDAGADRRHPLLLCGAHGRAICRPHPLQTEHREVLLRLVAGNVRRRQEADTATGVSGVQRVAVVREQFAIGCRRQVVRAPDVERQAASIRDVAMEVRRRSHDLDAVRTAEAHRAGILRKRLAGLGFTRTRPSSITGTSAEPVPDAAPPTGLSLSSRDIGGLGFAVTCLSRSNLLLGPGGTPACMAIFDDVVAPAGQSPVADRRPHGDGLAIVFEAPFATAQWQADFRAAAAGAQMLRQSVLHRYVEIAGLERWRHVIDPDRSPRVGLQAADSPFWPWRSRPVEAETSTVSMSCRRSFL